MPQQNLAHKALRNLTPRRPPKFSPRQRPSPRHSPSLGPSHLFPPVKVLRVHESAYESSRSQTAIEFARPGAFFPYFPSNTVFVFHPPRETARDGIATRAKGYTDYRSTIPKMSHVDILTTPTADTPGACLYVHFDKRRYLFGRLSEGVQRAFAQRKMAASSLEQIFVSGEVGWSTVGGMMGLLLTVADVVAGAKESLAEHNKGRRAKGGKDVARTSMERLDIHGAENLSYSLATARNFIFRTGMPFKTFELPEDRRLVDPNLTEPDWSDDCLRVWKVPLSKQTPTRKRRREDDGAEVDGDADMDADANVDPSSRKRQKSEERRALSALVDSMFDSDWRMDALVPTKLHDVKLPAAIFVRGDDHSIHKYRGPMPADGDNIPNVDVLVREPWPATKVHTLPPTQYSSQSMCYIVKNYPTRGKFRADLAKKLGVKPSDNKRLISGESIPDKDGNLVTPEMVLEPETKGQGFLVADIADPAYVASFLSRPEWANDEIMDGVGLVYWLLGKDMASHPDILAFMKERPQLKHIVLAPDACPNMIAFESHARLAGRLKRIDPERFPTLSFSNLVPDSKIPDAPFLAGRTGKRVKTVPQIQIQDQNIVPFFDPNDGASAMDKDILELAAAASAKVSDPEFLSWIEENEKDIPNRDAEITPLGTGSAVPSKYRNVSATLIRVPAYGSYLLDCGENTLGQMNRAYGYEETKKIMSELRCIVISHMHADHHLGTMSVIDAWQKATTGTSSVLSISCTDYMRRFIEEYSQVQPVDFARIRFYGDTHSDVDYRHQFGEGHPSCLSEIERVRVDHCKSAHACVLTWPSGLKIAYSGDCRPSPRFARAAKGATLLIHEATFDDDKAGDAFAKKHSTLSEALDIASQMEAKRVLLTHFSQRYAKVVAGGEGPEKGAEVSDRVVLNAFDQMRVKLGDFRKAEAFLPAIRRLLEEESK